MTLKWRGTLKLPPLPERKRVVGGNLVYQYAFAGAACNAAVHEADMPGHDLVLTELRAPFDRLYLRRKNARRRPLDAGVLRTDDPTDARAWPETVSRVQWDKGALDDWASTPNEVVRSWHGQFVFRAQQMDPPAHGLRPPQLGALHAIAGHFAVGKDFEPATVVLPTGAGKTETMLAVQVYRRLARTLVLVPSEVLRVQIGRKFLSLGVLSEVGVVPLEVARPRVALLRKGIATAEEARALAAESNVIVALPNSLAACAPEAVDALAEACTDLIVDEAHHVSAKSWDAVRQRFASKRILQFTATPFRQDGKRVGGKIIFNYKLGDAQDDHLYSPSTCAPWKSTVTSQHGIGRSPTPRSLRCAMTSLRGETIGSWREPNRASAPKRWVRCIDSLRRSSILWWSAPALAADRPTPTRWPPCALKDRPARGSSCAWTCWARDSTTRT